MSPVKAADKDLNSASKAIEAVYQEIVDLRKKQAATDAQVQRVQRATRLDEREFAVGQMQSNRELLLSVNALARTVSAFTDARQDPLERANEEGNRIYWASKDRRYREVQEHVKRIRELSNCKQRLTDRCPCGQHHGIMFVNPRTQEVEEENICPKVWWIQQSHLAYEEGRLGTFTRSTPMQDYLNAYKL